LLRGRGNVRLPALNRSAAVLNRSAGHPEITEEDELAERKRRGEDAVDDRLDEAFDDDTAVDDDLADDELDSDVDDDDLSDDDDDDDGEPVAVSSRGRSGRAGTSLTKTKDKADTKSSAKPGTRGRSTRPGDKRPTKSKSGDRPNIFARFVNFFREVVAELRKVIWPTRKELLTYTAVVVVFVSLMLAIVFGLDWVFAKGVLWVFGDGDAAAE
jgi:preprotein translocase subunit SecE